MLKALPRSKDLWKGAVEARPERRDMTKSFKFDTSKAPLWMLYKFFSAAMAYTAGVSPTFKAFSSSG